MTDIQISAKKDKQSACASACAEHQQRLIMRIPLLLLLLAAIFWQSCGSPSGDTAATPPPPEAIRPDTPFIIREIAGLARVEPPGKIITLNAETAGYVREVRFSEGSRVQKGEVLIVLNSDLEEAQLQQAQSKLRTQRAAISATQATLESLQVKLANARSTYERNQRLAAGNAATPQQLEDSRFAVEDWQKQTAAQQASIAQQQSRLKELEADVQYFRTVLLQRSLLAPMSGTFLSTSIKPGQYITNTTALGEFAMDGPYQAVMEVDELFATLVEPGQRAFIRMQGASERMASGKVVYVAPYLRQKSLFSDSPDNLEDRRVREARIQLDDNAKVLIGSRVECVIELNGKN